MSSTTDQNPLVTVNLFSFAITLLRNVRDKLMRDENNILWECKFVAYAGPQYLLTFIQHQRKFHSNFDNNDVYSLCVPNSNTHVIRL